MLKDNVAYVKNSAAARAQIHHGLSKRLPRDGSTADPSSTVDFCCTGSVALSVGGACMTYSFRETDPEDLKMPAAFKAGL
ncbi:hypothetical protein ACWGRV_15650 [Streptomyces sp. NPDC055663]